MPTQRATTIAQGFSQRLLKEMYDRSVLDAIVNRDYQGEINDVGSKLNIYNLERITEKDYDGNNLTPDDLFERNAVLEITKQKSFYWREKTIDNWKAYIKDPKSTVVAQKADERLRNMDLFAFNFYTDVAAGNRVGENYTTGTVSIDANGVVTGAGGASFTAAMVGRGFKADGHSTHYRVKQRNSSTEIVIEDDKDDVTSAYTGGVIGAGATYEIEAVTPTTITTANLLKKLAALKFRLDIAERTGKSAVPTQDRWVVLPPEFEDLVTRAQGIVLHVPEVYSNLIQKGMVGQLLGFKIFISNRLAGNNEDGYRVLAGHPNWLTFAEKILEAGMEEDLIGNFGSAYKDLIVYGGKVTDTRRHFAAEGFWTFDQS